MKQKIFLIIAILLLSIFGINIFGEFMANHTYYFSSAPKILANRQNRKLLLRAIIAIVLPLLYIVRNKVFSLKKFFVFVLPGALMLYTTAFVVIKDTIVGGSAGWMVLMINTLLIYFLGLYAILGLTAFGTRLSNKFIKFKEIRRQEMIINFGIGLGMLLLLIYLLTMTHLLRGIVVWVIFAGMGYMIRRMKSKMTPYVAIISSIADEFKRENLRQHRWKWIGLILLAISLLYYMNGFQLSIIPYSTAWDANHEYMYIPKVLAENAGVLRGNSGPAAMASGLRHMFITFWFALITPIKSRFWMAPDTIAVAMNFLSGMFVLIFGAGLIKEVIGYFSSRKEENAMVSSIGMYSGWMMLLFRLTSGMGAFLVFVDNKTDLGVMALTILAMLSGFIFIKYVLDNREHGLRLHRDSLKYIIISGVMFSRALMSKQTAFIDIAMFGLLLIGIRINGVVAIGTGIVTIGMLGILKIGNAGDMLNPIAGKYLVVLGIAVVIAGVIQMRRKKQRTKDSQRLLKYIGIWIVTIIGVTLLFKGPNVLIYQINNGTFTPKNFIKSTLLIYNDTKVLLATNEDIDDQNAADQQVVAAIANSSVEQCKITEFDKETLEEGMREAIATNEDVGRYVGYGRKEIRKSGGLNLGYGILRLFTFKDNKCYGTNKQAKLLCQNAQAIESFDVSVLQNMFAQMKPDTEAYDLLSGAIAAYHQTGNGAVLNPAEYRDEILALRGYYQDHAIQTQPGTINIPYRYLVPFNITFNRSLQNLSSYYTDIGFVRLMIFGLLVLGFFYALFHAKRFKQDTNLTVLAGIAIVGRAIWWIIGGGILRYGMGLIVWTLITVALIFKDMFAHARDEKETTMMYGIFLLFGLWAVIQFLFNFTRIASQGGGGPFLRYRMNHGTTIEISSDLQQKEIVKSNYKRKDVFDLQFPHYNKLIDYIKDRDDTDGVLIAGTYIQYFLHNQHNIKMDGMLSWFREQASDGNMCKAYHRLKAANLKYLVIDPNIGTVVMGEGNESLFNRFFAKRDAVTGKIEDDGAISMLVKLQKAGYIRLFSTNNLGAKYAFTLSDADFIAKFGAMSEDELVFLRAKLAIARFFSDGQELLSFIGEVFSARVANGQAIGDIADVYGKQVDEQKIFTTANMLVTQQSASEQTKVAIDGLTQDERLVLMQYLGLHQLLSSNNPQYTEYLNNIIGQSLGGGSQLIVFELN